MILKCNPNASFATFNDSTIEQQWLCRIPDRKEKHYQVTLPDNIYNFIQMFDGVKSLDDIKQYYCETLFFNSEQWAKLEVLLNDFLTKKQILIDSSNEAQFIDDLAKKPAYMQFQLPISPPKIVNFFSFLLIFLYQKSLAKIIIIFIFFSQVYFYSTIEPNFVNLSSVTSFEQISIILLVGLGLLFHELGHATAAYKYNCRKVTIGVGWYICFLVFYAELSEAWQLSRKQRVLVDSGGMYFQALFTSMLVIYLYHTGSVVVFYSIIMLNFSFLWNLNPFFRMDGYWIASDLLGIANLRAATNQQFNRIWGKYIRKNSINHRIMINNKAQNGLILYTVSSYIFFFTMVYVLGERLILFLVEGVYVKIDYITNTDFLNLAWLDLIVFFGGLIFQTLMIYFCLYFLFNMARNTIRFIKSYIN